jgi:VanZ family protein
MTPSTTIRLARTHNYKYAWIPVLFGLAVICGESTKVMGGANTGQWLLHLVNLFHHQADTVRFEEMNIVLRKTGHFFGYGLLGVMFARAWTSFLRKRVLMTWSALRVRGIGCGVLSACLVACADEFHQSFLPGRTATIHDVVIDTTGALLLNTIVFAVAASRRRKLIEVVSSLRQTRLQRLRSRYGFGIAA